MIIGRRRESNRAEGYDYSTPGGYYVTVCTHELRPMFGEVADGQMVANRFGEIVVEEWERTAELRNDVDLDAFVLMPNHFHGIIVIKDVEDLVRATRCVALASGTDAPAGSTGGSRINEADPAGPRATRRVARTNEKGSSLGIIVGQIKSMSSRRINRLRNTPGATIWHRNYYDHIIRDERDLDRVRTYIANNPANWPFDKANRERTTP